MEILKSVIFHDNLICAIGVRNTDKRKFIEFLVYKLSPEVYKKKILIKTFYSIIFLFFAEKI